jgi:hypothetical protein
MASSSGDLRQGKRDCNDRLRFGSNFSEAEDLHRFVNFFCSINSVPCVNKVKALSWSLSRKAARWQRPLVCASVVL